ncbi:hypothetical protein [Chryseobacterium jejuense]|uniref:Uncharacterized protein n=1 Tax=Chryseobacterium jejuense TaxID=445960 RepID=A0A2X2ZBH8_CHRJE|nr:hypothetical protein [Chryseobacterium jejuense]SDI56494.1 hypothetical protein SAMN05421542_1317 [Chryseobacterium jejuense]SQB47049.1 Uncharacterised protein [Chryseobacterium jejuense]
MIKRNYNYLAILILIILFSVILYFIIGGLAMDKGIGKLHYSNSLQEAEKEKTIISKYIVSNVKGKQINKAWLEYARSYDIFDNKKIEKDKISLRVPDTKEFGKIEDIYWEAFFKSKRLTIFEDKGIISVVEIDKNMDTIIIRPNKDEVFYIVKDN